MEISKCGRIYRFIYARRWFLGGFAKRLHLGKSLGHRLDYKPLPQMLESGLVRIYERFAQLFQEEQLLTLACLQQSSSARNKPVGNAPLGLRDGKLAHLIVLLNRRSLRYGPQSIQRRVWFKLILVKWPGIAVPIPFGLMSEEF